MIKLLKIIKANKQQPSVARRSRAARNSAHCKSVSGKKWTAVFMIENKDKVKFKCVSFGQKGASDYTIHKDRERRNRYIDRHMKDTKTNDPTRAGFLSLYVLWNKPSFEASVRDYKTRLGKYNKTGRFPTKIVGY